MLKLDRNTAHVFCFLINTANRSITGRLAPKSISHELVSPQPEVSEPSFTLNEREIDSVFDFWLGLIGQALIDLRACSVSMISQDAETTRRRCPVCAFVLAFPPFFNPFSSFSFLSFQPDGVKTNLGIGQLSAYETKKLEEVRATSLSQLLLQFCLTQLVSKLTATHKSEEVNDMKIFHIFC